ncbi:HPP family protein [Tamlana sp. 2_MG-2023]|uniref:HPP family protein n=1 Tax=unclassified Tamlana TaxID=2614803 RepID=UPI0026E1D776|nr:MULTISPECIES: HPP family protein [unclassified Tamlana]MDO6759166.1 HPP family protein [Tamlana sp. 2_MG-2023]MDO6790695.1 HPP family protein [Tamlana sp. 1_MG-2023]
MKNKRIKEKIRRQARISKYIIYKETLVDFREQFWSFIGAFFGIGLIALLQSSFLPQLENILLIGSFGASSVLIFGAIQSPSSQPRCLFGGHLISAFIGVTMYKLIPDIIWLTAPLAVATSIIAMQMTKTLHPPGGATALIAIIGTEKIKSLGYLYVISPVLTGCIILFVTALIFNNMTKHRQYPTNGKLTRVFKSRGLKSKRLRKSLASFLG